jgi:hypothetical protein
MPDQFGRFGLAIEHPDDGLDTSVLVREAAILGRAWRFSVDR